MNTSRRSVGEAIKFEPKVTGQYCADAVLLSQADVLLKFISSEYLCHPGLKADNATNDSWQSLPSCSIP